MSVTLMLLQPTYSLGAEHLVYLICKCRSPQYPLFIAPATHHRANAVSYTHLDVYKRQDLGEEVALSLEPCGSCALSLRL